MSCYEQQGEQLLKAIIIKWEMRDWRGRIDLSIKTAQKGIIATPVSLLQQSFKDRTYTDTNLG
jgi:hypothetical protein